MTRSRKKNPSGSVTVAESDKAFKERERRRERRAVSIALETGGEIPATKAFGDPWKGDKDGKRWAPDDPKIRRK